MFRWLLRLIQFVVPVLLTYLVVDAIILFYFPPCYLQCIYCQEQINWAIIWGQCFNSFKFNNDGNNCCIPPTLDGWVYIEPIHGPLGVPLYTWAQYTPTTPRSLNYRRSGVQDWTTRKITPPPQSELPTQRCSRLDNKKVNTPPAVWTTDAAVFKTGQDESTSRAQKG